MTGDEGGTSQRRTFFREAAARIIGPLAEYVEGHANLGAGRAWLRPPGAIEEIQLIETCRRCGACLRACPADAIFPLNKGAGDAAGTPIVDPDRAACVVCEELTCTTACPSGALLPVFDPRDIRMGLAEVYAPTCVRSMGQSCTLCIDRCPLGETAIRVNSDGPPEVLSPGCIGCGVCQFYCPTTPKAVVVKSL